MNSKGVACSPLTDLLICHLITTYLSGLLIGVIFETVSVSTIYCDYFSIYWRNGTVHGIRCIVIRAIYICPLILKILFEIKLEFMMDTTCWQILLNRKS